MEKTHWRILGGLALSAFGVGSYFLFIQKKKKEGELTERNGKRGSKGNNPERGEQTTKSAKGSRVTIPSWTNPYDISYAKEVKEWISPQRIYELHPDKAKQLATKLKEAYGGAWYSNDDEAAVKEVFSKMLKDKVQVSALSKAFWDKYQKDMWKYLSHFLSPGEMEEYVHQPVNQLPDYRIMKS